MVRLMRSGDGEGAVTFSLVKLQRLAAGFGDLQDGRPPAEGQERTLIRLAQTLGETAVPLCVRELGSPDEGRARWAAALLNAIAEDEAHRGRVMAALSAAPHGRASILLAELEGHGQAISLGEMAAMLQCPSEVARVADQLVYSMSADELYDFIDGLSRAEPTAAEAVIDEILLRADIDERFRIALRQLRAPLLFRDGRTGERKPMRRTRAKLVVRRGTRADGRRLLVASRRLPSSRPPRWRGLCCLIDERGVLIDALHRDDFTARGVERELIEPLQREEFAFQPVSVSDAADELVAAARTTLSAGLQLPRDFYLGRDLVGVGHEHVISRRPPPSGEASELSALLARAVELLRAGEIERAKPLLERYVAEAEDDPEGRAHLGLCLLQSGDAPAARPHLSKAADLAPDDGIHHWNMAALCHKEGRLGGCYLSLLDYQRHEDTADSDAVGRRRTALAFATEYERLARLEYPGCSARQVARADELVHASRACRGDLPKRIEHLRRAVRSAPNHYQAWSELGEAYAEKKRLADAQRCLERALALRGDYPPATKSLALVIEMRRQAATAKAKARSRKRRAARSSTAKSPRTRSRNR